MIEGKVPILYGMPNGPPIGYFEAKEKYFQNCDDQIIGGCIIDEKFPEYRNVYICEQCNENRNKWINENNSNVRWP